MKFIVISSILASLLFADEMARIESIVKDVGALRQKYEACQDKLDQIESAPEQCAVNVMELKQRHQEILALQKENESLKKEHASQLLHVKTTLTQTIASNEKKIAQLQRQNTQGNDAINALHVTLDERDKKITSLSQQIVQLQSQSSELSKIQEQQDILEKEKAALKREHASELLHVKTHLTQTIADHKSKISLLENRKKELTDQMKALQSSLDEREQKVRQLLEQNAQFQSKSLNLSKVHEQELALKKENQTLKKEIKALHLSLENSDQKQQQFLEKSSELQSKTLAYAKLEDENAKLHTDIEKLKAVRRAECAQRLPCKSEVSFPKLTMQPGFEYLQEESKSASNSSKTYRLKHESKIFDAINGKVIDTWEDQRSFTSSNQKEQWIQITGYFVNRQWRPARKESLWVKAEDAFLRSKK
jgi:chromosome segregation ATPase